MPACAVKLCRNNQSNNKKDTGITYHQFPVDPVIADRWTTTLRLSRQESWWKPKKRSVICSAHFNESDFFTTKGGKTRLHKGSVPKKALFLSSTPPDSVSIYNTVVVEPSTSAVAEFSDIDSGEFSDIDSVFDSPKRTLLKRHLHHKTVLQYKHARIIKTLREKTRRLKKANLRLRNIIRSLKQERFKDNDIHNILSKNVVAADLRD